MNKTLVTLAILTAAWFLFKKPAVKKPEAPAEEPPTEGGGGGGGSIPLSGGVQQYSAPNLTQVQPAPLPGGGSTVPLGTSGSSPTPTPVRGPIPIKVPEAQPAIGMSGFTDNTGETDPCSFS